MCSFKNVEKALRPFFKNEELKKTSVIGRVTKNTMLDYLYVKSNMAKENSHLWAGNDSGIESFYVQEMLS